MMQEIPGELFALRYGISQMPAHLILAGDDPERMLTLPWSFFLLRTAKENILIDCGFSDPAKAAEFGIELSAEPAALLSSIGVAPEEVAAILVTHHHFDHTGCLPRFPRARIIMQRLDYQPYRLECPGHPEIPAERLVLFDTECSHAGLRLRHVGGHTPGSIEISFTHDGVSYLITGDECYLRENYERRCPIGYACSPEVNRDYVARMPEGCVLLPFHDGTIFASYPEVAPGVVRIY